MIRHSQIKNVIFSAIDEVNEQLPKERWLIKSKDTVLFGKSGKLDSLGLVNLIVAIEQSVEDEFEVAITLADERAMSQKNSPFKTIGTLTDYICLLLEEQKNG